MNPRMIIGLAATIAAVTLTATIAAPASANPGNTSGTGSSAAPAGGQSSTTSPDVITPQAQSDCPATNFCVWVNSGYSDGPGKFAGANTNWGIFAHASCQTRTWNNCASSGFNNGTSGLGVEVWDGTGYTGLSACLPRGWHTSTFSGLVWPGSNTSFNDSISSNYWTSIC